MAFKTWSPGESWGFFVGWEGKAENLPEEP
jgi:hypothetical protein